MSIGIVYLTMYILDLSLANILIDLTTFNVIFYILFWESCIQIGMIRSNSKHKEFFEHSQVAAQILDESGRANLMSSQAVPISPKQYNDLREKVSITSENTVLQIAPITSGWVVKIAQDMILKQITLTSCYVKRKTNLLLQIDSGKPVTNTDMMHCYNESFRGLGLFGISCNVRYNPPTNTSVDIHLLCYDVFEKLLEKTEFSLEMIFVNCMEDERNLRFSIEISQTNGSSQLSFLDFRQGELEKLGGILTIYIEDDSITILLRFPRNKEVADL